MKTVKELRQEIDKVIVLGYTYNTNLSWAERLISINHGVGIGAKLVQKEYEDYEFAEDKIDIEEGEL